MAISNVGSNSRPGVCTFSTRPATPYEGQMIYETDTDMLAIWNGSAWRYIAATTPTSGGVLQVVTGNTSTQVNNNTNSYIDSGLTATITPKSSSSKILVQVFQFFGKNNGNAENRVQARLVRDTTTLLNTGDIFLYTATTSYMIASLAVAHLDSPNTTSATTYKTQFMNPLGVSAAVAQYGSGTSTIVLMEVAG